MLWLVGLMGVMAVGTVTFVDTSSDTEDDDAPPHGSPLASGEAGAFGNIIVGTDAFDDIDGTDLTDQISGYGGDDQIAGGQGDDEAMGDAGDDTLQGDSGEDTLRGGTGNDILQGGAGNDDLFGHSDDDVLSGEAGDDALQGAEGNGTLYGGAGNDTLLGGLDYAILSGGVGKDALFGGWGDDTLSGLEDDPLEAGITDIDGKDYLNGGGGDDVIVVGQEDVVTAGDRADQIILGDWIGVSNPAEVLDFDLDDDNLMLVWDDTTPDAVDPIDEIRLGDHPTDDEQRLIYMGNDLIATVKGSADITLIPLSAAPVSFLSA